MGDNPNVLDGYDAENMDVFMGDPGLGYGAGDTVQVDDEHVVYGGELGVVQAIGTTQAGYAGEVVVDVLVEGTTDAERFSADEVWPT